jgi:uncharacterized protein (DUF2062 family)
VSASEPATSSPKVLAAPKRPLLQRAKDGLIYYVLGVQDTPHHIALGVFLGFVVGFTPTIGLQLIIYVSLATAFRANKISGIPPVLFTNPVTAVPVFYFNWWIGNLATGGDRASSDFALWGIERLMRWEGSWTSLVSRIFEPAVWSRIWVLVVELWIGSFIVGGALGLLFYFITLEAVVLYRKKTRAS